MVSITKGQESQFTASADTLVQNTTNGVVEFQTDATEDVWGVLYPGKILEVPLGKTVSFKAGFDCKLPTVSV